MQPKTKSMQDNFIFPNDLQQHIVERLQNIRTDADILRTDDSGYYTGRIKDIKFKGTDHSVMSFKLDGRTVNNIVLTESLQMMLDLGEVTIYQLAVHHCLSNDKRGAVQPTLF